MDNKEAWNLRRFRSTQGRREIVRRYPSNSA